MKNRKMDKDNEPTDHSADCSSFMHLNHKLARLIAVCKLSFKGVTDNKILPNGKTYG